MGRAPPPLDSLEAQEAAVLNGIDQYELQRSIITRLVKASVRPLSPLLSLFLPIKSWSDERSVGDLVMCTQLPAEVKLQKDVAGALSKCSTVFINYLGTCSSLSFRSTPPFFNPAWLHRASDTDLVLSLRPSLPAFVLDSRSEHALHANSLPCTRQLRHRPFLVPLPAPPFNFSSASSSASSAHETAVGRGVKTIGAQDVLSCLDYADLWADELRDELEEQLKGAFSSLRLSSFPSLFLSFAGSYPFLSLTHTHFGLGWLGGMGEGDGFE